MRSAPELPRFAPRDSQDAVRGVTPLELMFDLAAVVAIGAAAGQLSEGVASGGIGTALTGFLCSFFMIWWAWMNYTWFASAHDDGSAAFRILTMVMMFGALMLAAGINDVFSGEPIWLALAGFILMRMVLVVFWLGAARGDPERRATAVRYAGGITVAQLYWIALVIVIPPGSKAYLPLFAAGATLELAVPAVAERKGATAWHRAHIVARYGRLTLIVLGQCFIAIVAALQDMADTGDAGRLGQAVLFALIAFSLWSLYFADEAHLAETRLARALQWGYGHVAVFAAAALVGSGMRVVLTAQGRASTAALLIGLSAAAFVASLWLIRDAASPRGRAGSILPVSAALLVAGCWGPVPALEWIAAILVLTAIARRQVSQRRAA
jgi:low temperature requirement protein LtrA